MDTPQLNQRRPLPRFHINVDLNWPTFPSGRDVDSHPLFKGRISRAAWRIYMHQFTPAGRWFLWPSLAFMTYGSSSLDLQVYVAFCFTFALWIVGAATAVLFRPRVSLRDTHPDRICAGQTLCVNLEVTQRGRLPGVELEVQAERLGFELDPEPRDGALIPLLLRGETGKAEIGILCKKRGVYPLPGYRVQTGYPIHLLYGSQVFKRKQSILVYPRFTRLRSLDMPVGLKYQPGGVALASTLGEDMEYLGNREYREGDNVRNIDWRATARLDMPIVREYREEYFLRVAVILDTHVPPHSTRAAYDDFERAVSLAAAVSDNISRRDYIVDLFAAGPKLYHLTAGRSLAYMDQILDILACVKENPDEPFAAIEPELTENLSGITTVICLFLDWNDTRRDFVNRLVREGVGVKVILVRDAESTLSPDTAPPSVTMTVVAGENEVVEL